MLHHVSIGVSELSGSGTFYDAVLSQLGYSRVWSADSGIGYGLSGGEDKFTLKVRRQASARSPGSHIAFSAPSKEAVVAFYEAALKHGGVDNGPPGYRPHYGTNYYAAFVIDPDGHAIEAVISSS
jgi:catechol 2,3-dioxygenase-like lactoylglutathione lyase family enzyme